MRKKKKIILEAHIGKWRKEEGKKENIEMKNGGNLLCKK